MTDTKICLQTGEEFVPTRPWQRFKDDKARQHYHAGWRRRAAERVAVAEAEAARQRARADKLAKDVETLRAMYLKGGKL